MDLNQTALTKDVIAAWVKIVEMSENGTPADKKGPLSVNAFNKRLRPFREGLRAAAKQNLKKVAPYKDFRLKSANYWQQHPKGALLKKYLWLNVGPDMGIPAGRFELSLCPDMGVQGEYVAYKVTQKKLKFHLQKLSKWFMLEKYLITLREELILLPAGFKMGCTCGNGHTIDNNILDLDDAGWQALRSSGLDPGKYFSIYQYHEYDQVKDFTFDQLAQLLVADIVSMARIFPILQNGPDGKLGQAVEVAVEEAVEKARTEEAIDHFRKLDLNVLARRSKKSKENSVVIGTSKYYSRDPNIAAFVMECAKGACQLCAEKSPFVRRSGKPFFESHHVVRRADGGPDWYDNVVALCPNCHRKVHHWNAENDLAKMLSAAQTNLATYKVEMKK